MSEIAIPYPLEGFQITTTHCRNQTIEIHATSTGSTSPCPHCGIASSRKHGWYRRSVQDLPIQKHKVVLKLQINRYRCDEGACPRRTFAESPTTLVGRYQRQTHQLCLAWVALGMALGGEAGSALGQHLSLPSSGDMLLRRVVQHPVPAVEEPTVVGIDDWAWKKRFRYGSIVVDLERNRPLALLPSRDAQSVSAWFKQHPSIRVVSRDRSGEYRRAIEVGAPQATQVADRWHLLVNLRTTLETALAPFASTIRQALRQPMSSPTTVPVSEKPSDAALADQARFIAMQARHAAGATQKAIAAEFNLHPRTVQRWLRANGPPPGKRAPRPTKIKSVAPFLRERYTQGCTNATQLWRELQAQGIHLSRTTVLDWVRLHFKCPKPSTGSLPAISQLAWLFIQPRERLSSQQQAWLNALAQIPALPPLYLGAQAFVRLIQDRLPDALTTWLAQMLAHENSAFNRFAQGLLADEAAVRHALTLPYSNGPVEGHIHRLKLLKRQMYGRAALPLLAARFLHTPADLS